MVVAEVFVVRAVAMVASVHGHHLASGLSVQTFGQRAPVGLGAEETVHDDQRAS
jgi:hypothetical protein